MENMDKIKLVVIDEHTLAYITPDNPNYAHILHASILKGSYYQPFGVIPITNRNVRMASESDFKEFRVDFSGYNNDNYAFQTKSNKIFNENDVDKHYLNQHGIKWSELSEKFKNDLLKGKETDLIALKYDGGFVDATLRLRREPDNSVKMLVKLFNREEIIKQGIKR